MPEVLPSLESLAAQAIDQGDLGRALEIYERGTPRIPGEPVARLQFAQALERRGRSDLALPAYYRAIIDAQRCGRWLNAATTSTALLDGVRHAMQVVKTGRRRLFDRALEPVANRYGAAAMARVADCIAACVGERRASSADPGQRPSYLYFPGLPASPWLDRSLFPWIAALEQETGAICEELLQLLPQADCSERVFGSEAEEASALGSSAGAPSWNGFYFWRHGEWRAENNRRCPRTSQALAALPLVHLRGQAPEVMFSVLTPGTHILPHCGVTNTRVVCHLPLVVPEGCALIVAGTRHEWREGQVVVFDDTYEHEAWNRGTQTRVVLIFDVWNPHLTEAERDGVTALIGAIDDFNRAASE